MKHVHLALLIVLCLLALPCLAQPLLQGTLRIQNQQGYMFGMTLVLENVGNEPFVCYFSNTEFCFYSIDGVEHHEMSGPMSWTYTLLPGALETYTMFSSSVLSPGTHVVQAWLDTWDQPLPVGDPLTITVTTEVDITIGNGAEYALIPIDFFWRTSMYECIFTAAELNHQPGTITAISIYPEFVDLALIRNIQIYLCNTTLSDLSGGWIRGLEMTNVLYDAVTFPINQDVIRIELSSGFLYNGVDNLAFLAFMPIHSDYGFHGNPCHADAANPLRARKIYSDNITYSAINPPAAEPSQHYAYIPQLTFHMIPTEPSDLSDAYQIPKPLQVSIYPNPVREQCRFKLDVGGSDAGCVEIFNLKGQKVRTLELSNTANPEALWDTRDREGKPCAAGIYLYRATSGASNFSGRLVLVK